MLIENKSVTANYAATDESRLTEFGEHFLSHDAKGKLQFRLTNRNGLDVNSMLHA